MIYEAPPPPELETFCFKIFRQQFSIYVLFLHHFWNGVWLTDWLIDWLTDWLIDWLASRLNDWLNNWLMWCTCWTWGVQVVYMWRTIYIFSYLETLRFAYIVSPPVPGHFRLPVYQPDLVWFQPCEHTPQQSGPASLNLQWTPLNLTVKPRRF